MGCPRVCAQIVLVLINLIFGLLGLVFLAIGVLIKVGDEILIDVWLKLHKHVGAGDCDKAVDFDALFSPFALALIVLGSFLFVMSCLGCFGACCAIPCMLILYCILVTLIVLLEVVAIIMFFVMKSQIVDALDTFMVNDSVAYYKNHSDECFSSHVFLINVLQQQMKCCGWKNGTSEYEDGRYRVYANDTHTLAFPITCCRPDAWSACQSDGFTQINSYVAQPCGEKVMTEFNSTVQLFFVIIPIAVLGAIQILVVALACCVIQSKRREDYYRQDDSESGYPMTGPDGDGYHKGYNY